MQAKKGGQVFTVEMQYEVVQRVLSGEQTKREAIKEDGIRANTNKFKRTNVTSTHLF